MNELERIAEAYRRREASNRAALYSLFQPDALLAAQHVERTLVKALERRDINTLAGFRILDAGCGHGRLLQRLVDFGAEPALLCGIDLRADAVGRAQALNPGLRFQIANAGEMPFGDSTFDLVFQFTMFTSILDAGLRAQIAAEMVRVLRPGGLIIWLDYHVSSPRNRDVKGVGRKEIERLFPNAGISLRRVVLAPPVARRVAPLSHTLAMALASVPWLCTHYLGVITNIKPSAK